MRANKTIQGRDELMGTPNSPRAATRWARDADSRVARTNRAHLPSPGSSDAVTASMTPLARVVPLLINYEPVLHHDRLK